METEQQREDAEEKMDKDEQNALMRKQIDSFMRQIDKCRETFDVMVFHHMIKELKSSPSARGYFKIERLRTLRTLILGEIARSRTDLYNPRPTEKVLQYYSWILSFIDYLKDLRKRFEQKIFTPLNTFFKDNFTPQGTPNSGTRRRTGSAHLENRSRELFTPVPPVLEPINSFDDERGADIITPNADETKAEKSDSYGRQALKMLGKELEEARLLYDDSQIQQCSRTIFDVICDWELLLSDGTELDGDIIKIHDSVVLSYSHMHKDLAFLASVIPTIFDDCEKASNAARDWIYVHETKTISLEAKLSKIKEIHKHLTKKLHSLELEILRHEGQLQSTSEELQALTKREERSNDINLKLFDAEQSIASMREALDRARNERGVLAEKLAVASKHNTNNLADIRLEYEGNRLQRYILQRKIQSKEYAKSLMDDDLHLELEMKPSIIRHSNALHDKCEKLEQMIEEKKHNRQQLQDALVPLQEDRRAVQAEILMQTMIGDAEDEELEAQEESLSGDILGPPINFRSASRSVDLITKLETIEERPDSTSSTATQRSTRSIQAPVQQTVSEETDDDPRPEPPKRASHLTTVKIGGQEKAILLPSVSQTIDYSRYEGMENDRSSTEPEPATDSKDNPLSRASRGSSGFIDGSEDKPYSRESKGSSHSHVMTGSLECMNTAGKIEVEPHSRESVRSSQSVYENSSITGSRQIQPALNEQGGTPSSNTITLAERPTSSQTGNDKPKIRNLSDNSTEIVIAHDVKEPSDSRESNEKQDFKIVRN